MTRSKTGKPAGKIWQVYILECGGKRLYTGSTNDIARRIGQHAAGNGARFTRAFGVTRLLFTERCPSQSAALKREAAIKRLSRPDKLMLIRKKSRA
jgi:predicted GIY-YIG superfamily endonuclease